MIKKACENDVPKIEGILADAIEWLKNNQVSNSWSLENIKWDILGKDYAIDEFYICEVATEPAGCVAITKRDTVYWNDDKEGEAFYIHKLAVKQQYRGLGITEQFITFAKEEARKAGCSYLKLDCIAARGKLRAFYEKLGFQLVKIVTRYDGVPMSLYRLEL